MALITMRQLLDHAAEYNYGVPAFNVNNLEQMRAIMLAADQTQSPVIVQASARAQICRRAIPPSFNPSRHGRMAAYSCLYASGSRHQPCSLPALDSVGL